MRLNRLAICVVLMSVSPARAELKLAALFSDHAVLQAGMEVTIWGWADTGDDVEVRLGSHRSAAKADAAGKWLIRVPPMAARATAIEMTITAGDETKIVRDVLIGEVWIGSGQSNMAMAVQRSADAESVIAAANVPTIRLFTVARHAATRPVADVDGKWIICSPERVAGFSAVLYHFGRVVSDKLSMPVGLIHSSWGGTPIQAWMPPEAFPGGAGEIEMQSRRIRSRYPSTTMPTITPSTRRGPRSAMHLEPTRLFNGMIAPLPPYPIRGVLWYQGENNVHQGDVGDYAEMMAAMARAWRSRWRQRDLPFLYVQLAPYGKYHAPPGTLMEMWDQQVKALRLIPGSGMAATQDVGDAADIHPKEKRAVGERLARIALAQVYHIAGIGHEAPRFRSARRENGKVRVEFYGAAKGLITKDSQPPLGFEVAGPDRKFVAAKAWIDDECVVVEAEGVTEPQFVRYAWSATPKVNLTNEAGLPAISFRAAAD